MLLRTYSVSMLVTLNDERFVQGFVIGAESLKEAKGEAVEAMVRQYPDAAMSQISGTEITQEVLDKLESEIHSETM